jgi:hypothetical protein
VCALKKTQNNLMPISLFVPILKIKQKSGIPFLPLFTFPASSNNICPRKWLTALMV